MKKDLEKKNLFYSKRDLNVSRYAVKKGDGLKYMDKRAKQLKKIWKEDDTRVIEIEGLGK